MHLMRPPRRSGFYFVGRFLVATVLLTAGCNFKPSQAGNGSGGSGGSIISGTGGKMMITGLTSLDISPGMASVSVSNGGPAATQQYKVTGTVNGQQQDLTSQVSYSFTPSNIITIDANGLATTTNAGGGAVTITATSGNVSTSATLVVSYTFSGADPGNAGKGVPTDAGSILSGAPDDPSRAPQLVYPNDGTLFPPNLTGIEIHFLPGSASNTLFQVSFTGKLSTVNAYVRCIAPAGINGCVYLPDPTLWEAVASANRGQGAVTMTVRGTDDSGTAAGTSSTFNLLFAKDDIAGALYYWTTSGKTAIMRWDFAGSTSAAMPYLTPTNTDGRTCVGCHALAPDGTKLVASAGGQGDGRLLLWNVSANAALQRFPLTQKSQFESWNADGTEFVGIYGDSLKGHIGPSDLMIFSGTTGQVTSTIPLGGQRADHPDWSKNPDGPDTIVYTSIDPTAPTTDQKPATGAIDYVQRSGGTWGGPQELVPAQLGLNRYYPAISPDGRLVVYDESTCTKGTPTLGTTPDPSCNADTDPTATMFVIPMAGGTPAPLTRANSPGVADGTNTTLTNSFPRWAPFVQKLDENTNLVWLTFSSTRQYGLRPPPPSTADTTETRTGTLIWMVGINPAVGIADPSYPAFCLPFQDITTSNHIAQWAKYFIMNPG
jgi:Tol biopolymer transport system component